MLVGAILPLGTVRGTVTVQRDSRSFQQEATAVARRLGPSPQTLPDIEYDQFSLVFVWVVGHY